jgi:hypothetical protein
LHRADVFSALPPYHAFFYKGSHMATPFFGKRDTDTPSSLATPTNLRSNPASGYSTLGQAAPTTATQKPASKKVAAS